MDDNSSQPSYVPIAVAIVVAGLSIALAIYMVAAPPKGIPLQNASKTVPAVSANDHILGNPDAPIKIIEYSDLDCPFCRTFHATMKQIMSVYGEDGRVAWVYRHFPIVELHPNAPRLAEASECVASLAGNAGFWKFIDGIFTSPSPNGRFDISQLDTLAAVAGAPSAAFRTCLDSGTFKSKVAAQFKEATDAGAQGTPHNIVVNKDGVSVPIPGAQPYATIKSIIDTYLADGN